MSSESSHTILDCPKILYIWKGETYLINRVLGIDLQPYLFKISDLKACTPKIKRFCYIYALGQLRKW